MTARALVLLACLGPALLPDAAAQGTAWRPEHPVELIVPAGPGGQNDLTVRNVHRVLQAHKLVDANMVVINKGGGGGAVAFAYLAQQQGNGHYLSISTVNLLTNHIVGTSALNYTDFTPLGHLIHSYFGIVVRPDSPIDSAKTLFEQLRKDPASLSVAIGTSLGNANHTAFALAVKASGGDAKKLRTVVFKSNGEALTALLGGHVDVIISGLPNLVKRAQARTVRILAITGPERLGGVLAEVPTLKEQGADVVVSGWRGVLGPRNLSAAQIAYWETVVAKLVETDEWKKELARNYSSFTRMNAAENREFLAKEYASFSALLTDLGMAKAK
jgi:putative tricarboxylic transport membrane protein